MENRRLSHRKLSFEIVKELVLFRILYVSKFISFQDAFWRINVDHGTKSWL